MPSNQDIAYKIFSKIKNLQDEQIKANTIKEADIVELEPETFIEDLNITVHKHLSAMGKLDIIDDVYKSILIKTQKAQSVNEFYLDNKIKIPEKMIMDTCLTVSEMRQATTVNGVAKEATTKKNDGQQSNFDIFSQQKSIKDKMDYYESLDDAEKEAVRRGIYGKIFGEETADQIINAEKTQEEIESTDEYKGFSNKQKEGINATLSLYNPMKYILEDLGISEEYLKKPTDLVRISAILEDVSRGERPVEDLKMYFGEGADIEKIIANLQLKLNSDEKFKFASEKVKDLINRNQSYISANETKIKNTLKQILPELSTTIDDMNSQEFANIFLLAYDKDGKINFELAAKFLSDAVSQKGVDITFDSTLKNFMLNAEALKIISISNKEDLRTIIPTEMVSRERLDENINIDYNDNISNMTSNDSNIEISEESRSFLSNFSEDDKEMFGEIFGDNFLGTVTNSYGRIEDYEGIEDSLADDIQAELQAIPVALQRINCSQEDIQKGLEAYKQIIGALTPEEIQYDPEMFAEFMERTVKEKDLGGVADEVLKMMSQITFNGQILEILKNSKENFMNSLDIGESILSQDNEQRVNEETLKIGFEALAVDLVVAEQATMRPEEILTDDSLSRNNEQLESSDDKENTTLKKLQSFIGLYKEVRTSDSYVSEVGDEIKLIVQEMEKELINDEKETEQESLE